MFFRSSINRFATRSISRIIVLAAVAVCGIWWWNDGGEKNRGYSLEEESSLSHRNSSPDRNGDTLSRGGRGDAAARADEIARIQLELQHIRPLERGDLRNEAAIALLHRWAEIEPEAAIEYANRHPGCHGDATLVAELFAAWLDRKSVAAESWFQDLSSGELRNRMLPIMVSRLASESPEDALALAGELPGYDGELGSLPKFGQWNHSDEVDHQLREQAYATIFREWTSSDPLAALGRAMGLEDPFSRNLALQEVARKWSQKDLAAAVSWAQQLPPGADRASALEGLITEWSNQEPRGASAFLATLPAGPEREQWLKELGENWSQRAPAEALAWAATLSTEEDQIRALCSVLAGIGKTSDRDAADQAFTLPPGPARQAGLQMILPAWDAREPEAVKAWLSRLPAESSEEIAEILPSH